MSYIINGPVIVGDNGQNTTIRGNLFTPNLTNATGDLIYCSNGGTGALSKLAATTNGFVLTLAAGLPSWAAAANSSTTPLSFSAFKSGTQAIVTGAGATTTTQITTWSTASPGFDGTGGQFATSNFTPTVTGTYLFTAGVSFTDTGNSGSRSILIRDTTAAATLASRQFQPTPDIAINQQVDICVALTLTATNVIQLQLSVTTGASGTTSTIQASPATFWSVVRLS